MSTDGRGFWRTAGDILVGPHLWRIVALIVVAVLLSLAVALIFRVSPESGFTDPDFTRALMTLLLLVSVIAAALAMMFAAIFSTNDNPQEGVTLKDRIAFGRDIMAPLVGILGTIVGFYFGSQQTRIVGEAQRKTAEAVATAAAGVVEKGTAGAVEKGAEKGTEKGVVKGVEKAASKGLDATSKDVTRPRPPEDATKDQMPSPQPTNPPTPR
jgi:hypothetical protein